MLISYSEFISLHGEPEHGRTLYNIKGEKIGAFAGTHFDKLDKVKIPKNTTDGNSAYPVAPERTFIKL